jgi:hypothetical protein
MLVVNNFKTDAIDVIEKKLYQKSLKLLRVAKGNQIFIDKTSCF